MMNSHLAAVTKPKISTTIASMIAAASKDTAPPVGDHIVTCFVYPGYAPGKPAPHIQRPVAMLSKSWSARRRWTRAAGAATGRRAGEVCRKQGPSFADWMRADISSNCARCSQRGAQGLGGGQGRPEEPPKICARVSGEPAAWTRRRSARQPADGPPAWSSSFSPGRRAGRRGDDGYAADRRRQEYAAMPA